MNSENPLAIWGYTILASIAGALTALSFRPFATMSRAEVLLSLIAGASFAFFVGPWFARMIFGSSPVDLRVMGALLYMMGTASNVLIPLTVKRISAVIGSQ